LIELRKGNEAFSGGELEIIRPENDHVLGFIRSCGAERALIFANFSEAPQTIAAQALENLPSNKWIPIYGSGNFLSGQSLEIAPLQLLVFTTSQA
jgi:amylosucrase